MQALNYIPHISIVKIRTWYLTYLYARNRRVFESGGKRKREKRNAYNCMQAFYIRAANFLHFCTYRLQGQSREESRDKMAHSALKALTCEVLEFDARRAARVGGVRRKRTEKNPRRSPRLQERRKNRGGRGAREKRAARRAADPQVAARAEGAVRIADQERAAQIAHKERTVQKAREQRAARIAREHCAARIAREQREARIAREQRAAHIAREQREARIAREQRAAHIARADKAAFFVREERATRIAREEHAKSCVLIDTVDLCTPPTRRRLSFSRALATLTRKDRAQGSTQVEAFSPSKERRAVVHKPIIAKRQPRRAAILARERIRRKLLRARLLSD